MLPEQLFFAQTNSLQSKPKGLRYADKAWRHVSAHQQSCHQHCILTIPYRGRFDNMGKTGFVRALAFAINLTAHQGPTPVPNKNAAKLFQRLQSLRGDPVPENVPKVLLHQ